MIRGELLHLVQMKMKVITVPMRKLFIQTIIMIELIKIDHAIPLNKVVALMVPSMNLLVMIIPQLRKPAPSIPINLLAAVVMLHLPVITRTRLSVTNSCAMVSNNVPMAKMSPIAQPKKIMDIHMKRVLRIFVCSSLCFALCLCGGRYSSVQSFVSLFLPLSTVFLLFIVGISYLCVFVPCSEILICDMSVLFFRYKGIK